VAPAGLGLPRACRWAKRLGTGVVSCFAFRRDDDGGPMPDAVVERLGQMADIAQALAAMAQCHGHCVVVLSMLVPGCLCRVSLMQHTWARENDLTALGRMQAHNCRLVLENEAVCWGATGVEDHPWSLGPQNCFWVLKKYSLYE
jgi:hypothetical protein